MKLTFSFSIPVLFIVFNCTIVSAQSLPPDSTSNAIANSISVYNSAIGDQSGIFNGTQYYEFPFKITTGHPFFMNDNFIKGNIIYDGISYSNIPLKYDEIAEQLVTTDITGRNEIMLINDKVQSFEIDGYPFINISSTVSGTLTPGFYRVLYNGRSQVIVKESKYVVAKPLQNEVERTAYTRTSYYFRLGRKEYKINNARSLFVLLGPQRQAVRDLLIKNRLRYKKDKGKFLIAAASFFDQLTL